MSLLEITHWVLLNFTPQSSWHSDSHVDCEGKTLEIKLSIFLSMSSFLPLVLHNKVEFSISVFCSYLIISLPRLFWRPQKLTQQAEIFSPKRTSESGQHLYRNNLFLLINSWNFCLAFLKILHITQFTFFHSIFLSFSP